MAKFDNAKVGDRVWYIIKGWGEVEHVIKNIGIRVRFKVSETVEVSEVFTFDGKRYELNNKYPMLFWNEVKLPTDEEDKKPFNLIKFLRENLKPKEFEQEKSNRYISYEYDLKEFEYYADYHSEDIGTVYIEELDDYPKIISELTINKVTPQQLKQAYKELGWL